MIYLTYCIISLIGVYVSHRFSQFYVRKRSSSAFFLWLVVALYFNVEHYSILFNKEFVEFWWFFIPSENTNIDGFIRLMSFVFLLLTSLTVPPSTLIYRFKRLGFWLRVLWLLLLPKKRL